MKKRNEGITLIALVITIIVLIILAGISISILTGDSGIINQSKDTKLRVEIGEEIKLIDLAVINAIERNRFGELKYNEFRTELERLIKNEAKRNYILQPERDAKEYIITYTDTQRSYIVNGVGEIAQYNGNFDDEVDGEFVSCDIEINVNTTIYNATLGSYPVVFSIKGEKDGEIVYDNVESTEIYSTEVKQIYSYIIVPKGTKLTVTQIYSGASYKIDSESTIEKVIADNSDIITFDFKNSYNYKNIRVTYVYNQFENYDGEGWTIY